MAERVEASVTDGEQTIEERHIGAMWELEKKLDQPMDEEANKLKSMDRGKVYAFSIELVLDYDSDSCCPEEIKKVQIFYKDFSVFIRTYQC